MVGPAIALALLFAINALIGIWPLVEGDAPSIFGSYENLPATLLLAGGALFLWWLRYRVPFAMAPIALAIVTAALVFAAGRAETPASFRDIFLFSATGRSPGSRWRPDLLRWRLRSHSMSATRTG